MNNTHDDDDIHHTDDICIYLYYCYERYIHHPTTEKPFILRDTHMLEFLLLL